MSKKLVKRDAKREPDQAILNQVTRWILSGATEHEVAEAIQAKWPDQASQPLIIKAMDAMINSSAINADAVKGWCFEATREVYRRAIEVGDLGVALRAIKQLSEIAG